MSFPSRLLFKFHPPSVIPTKRDLRLCRLAAVFAVAHLSQRSLANRYEIQKPIMFSFASFGEVPFHQQWAHAPGRVSPESTLRKESIY